MSEGPSSGTRTVLSKRTIISQSVKTVKCEEDASAGSHDRLRKGGSLSGGGGGANYETHHRPRSAGHTVSRGSRRSSPALLVDRLCDSDFLSIMKIHSF